MKVIICPGIHDPQLTASFVASLSQQTYKLLDYTVFPTQKFPAYSAVHLFQWLNTQKIVKQEILLICFSAGVVAGIGTAFLLQLQGIKIKALIAVDGWGVPLWANFPVYRISHDYFTHWSSALLGTGKSSFYCDPGVDHLTLWESPEVCQGWFLSSDQTSQLANNVRGSAIEYLHHIIDQIIKS